MPAPQSPDPHRPLRNIGLFINPSITLARQILAGFSSYALKHPEWVLWPVYDGWEDAPKQASIQFDAIIAFMGNARCEEIFRHWAPRVINVSNKFDLPNFASVVTDDHAVGRLAACHYLDRGFTEFACVAMGGFRFAGQRLHGFSETLKEAGTAETNLHIHQVDPYQSSAEQEATMEAFISALPRPVAIFADTDWSAFKVRRICLTHGIAIPDEVAILGVDNDPCLCQLGNAALSSIELDGDRIGRVAAAWIEEGLKSGQWPVSHITIPPAALIERLSTEHAAVEDPLIRKALQFIRHHAILGAGVEQLCEHLAITRRSLDRRFLAHNIPSPHELILQRRIEYARRLLRETDEKLESIAYSSGFNDIRTFARVFAKHEPVPPAAYRKRYR